MPRGDLSAEEEAAGKIVAQHLGGEYEARDVRGAPDATHDLDVVLAGGRRVALEVTSAGDREIEELYRLLVGRTWEAPSLRHHWWLGIPDDPRIRDSLDLLLLAERLACSPDRRGRHRVSGWIERSTAWRTPGAHLDGKRRESWGRCRNPEAYFAGVSCLFMPCVTRSFPPSTVSTRRKSPSYCRDCSASQSSSMRRVKRICRPTRWQGRRPALTAS